VKVNVFVVKGTVAVVVVGKIAPVAATAPVPAVDAVAAAFNVIDAVAEARP
jgi:hypothetical protein